MTAFSTPDFHLQRVTYPRTGVVRARFTYDPVAADPNGTNDATNRFNYTLTGSHLALPVSVIPVSDDPQAVDISLNTPLATGTWRLTVSSAVESLTGDTLQSPVSLDFQVAVFPSLLPANGGGVNDDSEDIVRRHLPSLFTGPGWEALIAAVAVGDDHVRENGEAAFDQLFRSSASGIFLDRRAASDGVSRPTDVGMSDELFRTLLVRTANDKVTHRALIDLLEVFYGTEAVCASVDCEQTEPYELEDGWTLGITDGRDSLDIAFSDDDFAQIGSATADEVCVVINRACRDASLPIRARPVSDPVTLERRVRLTSKIKGLASRVGTTGGLALNAMTFPNAVDVDVATGSAWSIEIPEAGIARLVLDDPDPVLLDVRVDDVVNITCSAFAAANRGSYVVVAVRVVKSGADWEQWLEVENASVEAQGGPLTEIADDDVLFYRLRTLSPQSTDSTPVILAQATYTGFDVRLPATSAAVSRIEGEAAYLQPRVTIGA